MIEEAYVSYETAKLLKEKGFNAFLPFGFNSTSHTKEPRKFIEDDGRGGFYDNKEDWISCPTHQMAMDWLREKGYHIEIIYKAGSGYYPVIRDMDESINYDNCVRGDLHIHEEHKKAVEEALKHVLENLI